MADAAENVDFLGSVGQRQLPKMMSESHVLVLPSIEDGFGLVLSQGLACGCPILASTNTGGDDLITNGTEGFIVPVRDVPVMTGRMQRLADDSDLQRRSLQGLAIGEVATTLQPDGRTRAPHLRTWRDGWRHLQFLLMYSPRWLFFYPGIALTVLGLLLSARLIPATRHIGRFSFDVDTLTYALGMLLIGVQIVVFAISAQLFGTREGFLPPHPHVE